MIARLRAWRRRRVDADPLVRDWEGFRTGRPTHGGLHRRTPAPAPRPRTAMPGDPFTRDSRVMASYARLWQLALIRAERKLHGAVLP
jgi:hypothetical protein